MFAKFSAAPEGERKDEESVSSKPRPKRHQVSRACVWCRTYRIKCDASYPCSNCKAKGRKCTVDETKDQLRTFPSAIREIDRLKERVKELEDQLRGLQVGHQHSSNHKMEDEGPFIKQEEALPEELDPLSQHGGNKRYYNWDFATREIKPGSNQTYGSSSTFYFIHQLSSYLDATLQQKASSADTVPNSPSSTAQILYSVFAGRNSYTSDRIAVQQDFLRSEEERLLNIYWRSWNVLYPILDEEAFRTYYNSLWNSSSDLRDPSALVDIVLALCMQYDAAEVASRLHHDPYLSNATDSMAGWWFYRRCQYFLQDDMENPSITTFQCHFLAAIWLSRASWQNAAHNVLAAGLRIGVILGLHVEPCPDLPPGLREYRRRLWWTMYAVDAQYAMELGRPLGVHFGQVTCNLPQDDARPGHQDPEMFTPASFNTQLIKLILAARTIYIQFYRVCAKVLRQNGQANLYHSQETLEACAEWLDTHIRYLEAWLQQVPEGLKTPRENLGQPYSIDRSRLDLSSTDSRSRGRLILEILYHQFAMSLHRPFITFLKNDIRRMPVIERHAISCVNHAITITAIIHQDITESENLQAWQIVCTWLWNAALSLLGYVVAYPRGPATPNAHKALSTAVKSFKVLSHTFTNAMSAEEVLQGLLSKLDTLSEKDQSLAIAHNGHLRYPLPVAAQSAPESRNMENLDSEWHNDPDHNLTGNWLGPEFNLEEFSTSEDSIVSKDWVLNMLDFGPME
ncbi:Nn.00g103860.m01.CDS01 [Neocucurbitaria sp. VM-36]